MSSLNPLAEYLLALRRPGGGMLCRWGVVAISVPIFPAGISISWEATPPPGIYAQIEFFHRYSSQMVPSSFDIRASHKGMLIQAGNMGELATDSPGYNLWVEITQQAPALTTIENVSAVDQLFENMFFYLVIDTQHDLDLVHDAVRAYGRAGPQIDWQGR